MSQAPEMKIVITGDASQGLETLKKFAEEVNKGSKAVDGLSDSIGSKGSQALKVFTGDLVKAAASFGSATALASKAADMIISGLRAIVNFVPESIQQTNSLTVAYKQLNLTAGLSQEEFNAFHATLTLTGGSIDDLNDLVQGMERGIKKNSDALVLNGIAGDKAALSHLTLQEYISRVVKAMDQMGSATDRDQLLMAAFGRSGMQFASALKEINDHMEEGRKISERGGGPISNEALRVLNETREAQGRLKIAEEEYAAIVAENAAGVRNSLTSMKAAMMENLVASELATRAMHQGLIQVQIDAVSGEVDLRKLREEYEQFLKTQREVEAGSMDVGTHYGPKDRATGHYVDPEEEKRKKEAAQRAAEKAQREFERVQREADQKARTEKEVIYSLQERSNRLAEEGQKIAEATTIQERQKRAEDEALLTLQREFREIDHELDRSNTPEAQQAALDARNAAYQRYLDQKAAARRQALQEEQEENKKAALEHLEQAHKEIEETTRAREQAISDLRKELAEMAEIKGGLTQQDTNEVLGRYEEGGSAKKAAAQRYREENHIGEGAFAGVQGGMQTFLAQQENEWNKWKGFTVTTINGVAADLATFYDSALTKGGSVSQKLQQLAVALRNTVVKSLSDMAAQETIHWGIQKAKEAWNTVAQAKEKTAQVAGATATTAAMGVQSAAMGIASTAASELAAAETWAAYADIPFAGEGLALAQIAEMEASLAAVAATSKGEAVAVTAAATGAVFDSPTLTLLGEAGEPEVVAPRHDFLDWANANQNLGMAIGAHQARISSMHAQASSYGMGGLAASGGTVPGAIHADFRGAIFASTTEGKRALDQAINESNGRIGRSQG